MEFTCPYCHRKFDAKDYGMKAAATAAEGIGRYVGKAAFAIGGGLCAALVHGTAGLVGKAAGHHIWHGGIELGDNVFGKSGNIKVVEKVTCPKCHKKFSPFQ